MRLLLLDGFLIVIGILAGRLCYTGLYKPKTKPGLAFYYGAGSTLVLVFYITWAVTGMDPIQLTICSAFPTAPVCEEKRVQRDFVDRTKVSDKPQVAAQIPKPQGSKVQAASPPASKQANLQPELSPSPSPTPYTRQEVREEVPVRKVEYFTN